MVEAVSGLHDRTSKLLRSAEEARKSMLKLEHRSSVAIRLSPGQQAAFDLQFTSLTKMHIRLKPMVNTLPIIESRGSKTASSGSKSAMSSHISPTGSPPRLCSPTKRPIWRSSSAPRALPEDSLNSRYKRTDPAAAPHLSDRSQHQFDDILKQFQVWGNIKIASSLVLQQCFFQEHSHHEI